MTRFSFEAIGTPWEIETLHALDPATAQAIMGTVEAFDATYSRFRGDSLVSQMARAAEGGTFTFPQQEAPLFDLYDRLHAVTGGAVDPLIGRDLELLGYNAAYTLTPAPALARPAARCRWIDDVRRDGTTLVTRRPVVLDLGAVGKGYLVDLVSELLAGAGVGEFTVDAGGDIRHRCAARLRVGLEHPTSPACVIGVVELGDGAVCGSAVNRRAWGDGLHHVLDGRTGRPVEGVIATWAIAGHAALADGLATALFFQPAQALSTVFDFSSVRMFANGRVEPSDNFIGELFT